MSKIVKSKSKLAQRYDADIWNFLIRPTPKLTKATTYFCSLSGSNFNVGSDVFAGITRKLYMSKLRRRNYHYKLLRNKARLRLFLGGVNNQHVKNLSKLCWRTNLMDGNFFFIFERRLDVFLYRIHFASSVKEARSLIKQGKYSVNGIIVKHPAYLLKLNDEITISDLAFKKELFNRIEKQFESNSILWYAPPYVEVNYRLFCASFIRFPKKEEIIYPYSIDLSQVISFYKTTT